MFIDGRFIDFVLVHEKNILFRKFCLTYHKMIVNAQHKFFVFKYSMWIIIN